MLPRPGRGGKFSQPVFPILWDLRYQRNVMECYGRNLNSPSLVLTLPLSSSPAPRTRPRRTS